MSEPTKACRAEAALWRRRTFLQTSGMLVASVAAISVEGVDAFLQRTPAAGPVSRSRFPAARFVDRDPPRQHRDVLRRQDRSRPGHRHGVPPDHVGRARHRLREHDLRDGQHRRHRRSRRLGRIGCAADRRLSDAARRRRSAPRAARHGVGAFRRAGHRAGGQRRRDQHQARRHRRSQHHLRRADRRQEVQRHADRPQHRCDDGQGAAQAGAGDEERRQVAAPRRHSGEGQRHAALGRGHESAGHAARAQRPPAGRRRHAQGDRRIVGEGRARVREGREPRQLRRGGVRARGARDPRRAPVESRMDAAGGRAVPHVREPLHLHAIDDALVHRQAGRGRRSSPPRSPAPPPSSRRNTTCRSRATPRSVPRTRWPIRRTVS